MPPPTPKYFQIAMAPAKPSPPEPSSAATPPTPSSSSPEHPKPLLRLELRDLSLPGTHIFLRHLVADAALSAAVTTVLDLLYPLSSSSSTSSAHPKPTPTPTRSITLVVRSLAGVAYTTGKDIDSDHKEIHLSTDYIEAIAPERRTKELTGVLVHEMVHCWQWNALGTAPGGLIEGIADWVRLRAGLEPPHWKRERGGKWDAGYQHTGYFLDWLEGEFGAGTVVKVNTGLRDCKYEAEAFWKAQFGKGVEELWEEYTATLPEDEEKEEAKEKTLDEPKPEKEGEPEISK